MKNRLDILMFFWHDVGECIAIEEPKMKLMELGKLITPR
jgi:hypothetical protein